jgi:DcaP outer membrane protein
MNLLPAREVRSRSIYRIMPARTAAAIGLMLALLAAPLTSFSQTSAEDAATIAALREQVAALERRLDAVERRQAAQSSAPSEGSVARSPDAALRAEVREAKAAAKQAQTAAAEAKAAQRTVQAAPAVATVITPGTIEGLLPPEPMGSQMDGDGDDALRSDLPGISLRIPNTDTEVRVYGFAKTTAWRDFNGRNQTAAPTVQTIPLNGSSADLQGGDFGVTARFSRIGIDTRTLTDWGTLETRIEGDFGGGAATSTNAVFRLRQAWGELGTEAFRVLLGQANSLWNEGVFETLIDSTNLNQSFVRQAQIRVTGRLAPGLTGQFSLEAPETNYTAVTGAVNPGTTVNGGASPAFDTMPDFLGRLTYRENGLEIGGRALLRNLTVRADGTAVAPPSETENAIGWGIAGHVRFPMRWISKAFGPDELLAMAYYGDGIGRYFPGNTSGQDALSNLGLPAAANNFSLNPVQSWGVTAAYRRFWTPTLRSNFAFSYARQDYPDYALGFVPGSAAATSLNREMEQGIVNLIWSPFGSINDGVFSSGWLDIGVEYIYSHRELFGGATAAGTAGDGDGDANRILFGGIIRF